MRAVTAIGSGVAALLALAVPATAGAQTLESSFTVTGEVAVTWTGPGGVEGSLLFTPGGRGSLSVDQASGGLRSVVGGSDSTEPAIVRVRRPGPDGSPVACVDRLGDFFAGVSFDSAGERPFPDGTVEVSVGGATFGGGGLSAGRCAGPVTADLASALPAAEVDLRRLRRGGRTLALDGRRTFPASDFTVAVDSTVKVRLGRARVERERAIPRPRPSRPNRPRRVALVSFRYAVDRIEGAFTTDFRAQPGILCGPLDACGLSGTNRVSFDGAGGELVLQALARRPRAGRRPTVAGALRDLRRGRLRPGGVGRLRGDATVSASVTRDGAPACRDERRVPPPVLEALPASGAVRVAVAPGGPGDLARTRCPGPLSADGTGSPAGRIANAQLAAPEARLVLRPGGSFADGPYAATLGGEVAIVLRRVGVRTRLIRTGRL